MAVYDPEARLAVLGLHLPLPPRPVGSYRPHLVSRGQLFISGQGPSTDGCAVLRGIVGVDFTIAQARAQAESAALNMLSVAKEALGTLRRVSRVCKITGYIAAAPDFRDHPAVLDGCSELLVSIFGSRGQHVRSAVGVYSLPGGYALDVEAMFEVEE